MRSELGNGELVRSIVKRIGERPAGCISFCEYMEMCLYDADGGYYTSERPKVGKAGDFYTSQAIGGIMGEMLARYIAERLVPHDGRLCLVEWGGGDGGLARQILDTLREQYAGIYDDMRYVSVERSPYHRALQMDTLREHADTVRFMTAEEWQQTGDRSGVVVLSNELLDAFPVHRLRCSQGVLSEIFVGWDAAREQFREIALPCTDEAVLEYIRQGRIVLAEGQTAEINLSAGRWIGETVAHIGSGHIVTIDYGDIAAELFAPHRMNGTLVCYKRHLAHDDPYIHAGEQDITTHVDFSACIRAGLAAGVTEWKLLTQREFLVEAGILSLLQNHQSTDPFSAVSRRNRAIRQLLLSDRMSELFKVLVQTKREPFG